MADPIVQIEGAVELARTLRATGDRAIQRAIRAANKHSAEIVVQKALPHVPVGKTGRLKASVRATGGQAFGAAVAGSPKVPYAAAIHWGRGSGNTNFKHGRFARGTKGGQRGGPIQGRPFLKNAADASMDEIVSLYTREIVGVLRSQGLEAR